MRKVSRFAHIMSSTVLVAARTCQDAYGKPGYGDDVEYQAHIGHKRQLVRTASGEEVASEQVVWLATRDPILPTARITLSTSDIGSTEAAQLQPPIVAVNRRNDQYGPHHVVVYL